MSAEQLEVLKELSGAIRAQTKMLEAFGGEMHTKTPAATSSGTLLHGPSGAYTGPGLERDVISAHVRPFGIAGHLPRIPSVRAYSISQAFRLRRRGNSVGHKCTLASCSTRPRNCTCAIYVGCMPCLRGRKRTFRRGTLLSIAMPLPCRRLWKRICG